MPPFQGRTSTKTGLLGTSVLDRLVLFQYFLENYKKYEIIIFKKIQMIIFSKIYSLIILAAIPLASLNILPNAILAEIIEKDTLDTNTNKEGIYFAVRYFFVKIAQTFGIALFAMFLLYGKDVGNDFGIRLTGILGFVLCLLAAIIFTRFKELKKR